MTVSLAVGPARFADDILLPGMLYARVLRSPHAHAQIVRLDASPARTLPGVVLVLAAEDLSPPGSAPPILDRTVRFVGDRVAVVAAEDPDVAYRAAEAVRVEYQVLPAVLDPERAGEPEAPLVHEGPGNLAGEVQVEVGNVDRSFAEADRVFEATYRVAPGLAGMLEPHVALTWLDPDRRLIVRTSSAVPFHVRRSLAALLGMPAAGIKVIAPGVGGGFAGKHDLIVEDLCGLVTLRTGRPVRLLHTLEEELTATSARPAQDLTLKTGVKEGRITAIEVRVLENVGARRGSAAEGLRETGRETLGLYRVANARFQGRALRTHLPPGALFPGGAGLFALESHVDEVAAALGEDPLEFRLRNQATPGDKAAIVEALGGAGEIAQGSRLVEAARLGAGAIEWGRRWKPSPGPGPLRRGIGLALARHAPSRSSGERGVAALKMTEDGSFALIVGPAALGAGAERIYREAAARCLGVAVERVVLQASDTDASPFDPGATAPTPQPTERAVQRVAELLLEQIRATAARLLRRDTRDLTVEDGWVRAGDGAAASLAEVALAAIRHGTPVGAEAFHSVADAPPAGVAVFAQVEVDLETGRVRVLKLVEALDVGPVEQPRIVEAQVEGDTLRALGEVLHEQAPTDRMGGRTFRSLRDHLILTAIDAPEIVVLLAGSGPASPLGAKALGGLAACGPAAAIANAVAHATGARVRELPLAPARVVAAIDGMGA
ncbi:MAG TPA: molybdopterin cofactor-binding domain-containing protein [Vicinamibacteria bacterium]|jgi:putative selenate reductase molybdopterin-binding subunit|nr:molybdopterin cofactor-binding domain-containing protein [Vicinamibacteria bacterium]